MEPQKWMILNTLNVWLPNFPHCSFSIFFFCILFIAKCFHAAGLQRGGTFPVNVQKRWQNFWKFPKNKVLESFQNFWNVSETYPFSNPIHAVCMKQTLIRSKRVSLEALIKCCRFSQLFQHSKTISAGTYPPTYEPIYSWIFLVAEILLHISYFFIFLNMTHLYYRFFLNERK